MKLLFTAVVATLMTTSSALSDSIKFHIPYKAGGGGFMISDLMVKGLQERGWNVDFKVVGNCAIVKDQLETEKEPFVALWDNGFMVSAKEKCYFELPSIKEIVNVPASSPYAICVKPDSHIKPEDIVGSTPLTITVFNDTSKRIVEKLQTINPNLKPIAFEKPTNALVSGEVDVYLGTQGIAMQNSNQAKCYFNTGDRKVNGSQSLSEAKGLKMNEQNVYFTIVKNLPENKVKKMRADVREIMKTEEWKKLTSRWNTPEFKSIEEEYKFIENIVKQ